MKHITETMTQSSKDLFGYVLTYKPSQKVLMQYLADTYFSKLDAYDDCRDAIQYAVWLESYDAVTRLSNTLKKLQPAYRAALHA